jgi:crossover junction endodeoxyribonuclease RuvC
VLIIGIDPGVTGAIAAMTAAGALLAVEDLPAYVTGTGTVKRQVSAAAFAALVRELRVRHGVDAELAVIERVASRPGQGVSSTFSLGHTAGVIEGVLGALGVPVVMVAPASWKKAIGLPPGSAKDASAGLASRLFPAQAASWRRVKDHNRAEAALLAEWARRTQR